MKAVTANYSRRDSNTVANTVSNVSNTVSNTVVNNNQNNSSMENIFDSIREYGGNWECVDVRYFNQAELAGIKEVLIKASEFGRSACFLMANGKKKYIPVDNNSELSVGDTPDPSVLQIKKLKNVGDNNKPIGDIIVRVDVEPADEEAPLDFDNPLGV